MVYRVFQMDLLSEQDKSKVREILPTLKTPHDAARHMNWRSYQQDAKDGRVFALAYKGIEVALMFKREFTPVEIKTPDPEPMRYMTCPNDAWAMLSLLDGVTEVKGDTLTLERLQQQVARLTQAKNAAEQETILMNQQKENLEANKAQLEAQMAQVKAVALTRVSELESAGIRARREAREALQEKDKVRADASGKLLELFNVAAHGLEAHPDDQMLKLQIRNLGEALQVLGVTLIAPSTGTPFDPNFHNAVDTNPEAPANKVSKLYRCGAYITDNASRVIAPADVVVGLKEEIFEPEIISIEPTIEPSSLETPAGAVAIELGPTSTED